MSLREFSKRLKFDHTDKWYSIKPESALINERHNILDFLLINKTNCD